jgi:O-antigen ligase
MRGREEEGLIIRVGEAVGGVLLGIALGLSQVLIGGVGLLFGMPAYALLAVVGFLSVFLLRERKPAPDQLCLVSSALFFGYILGRGLLSPVPYLARADIYSVLGGLLVYGFVACVFNDARRRLLVVAFLFVLAMVHVFVGAIQFRDGNNFMLISFLQRYDYGRRASGFYICPNHLAGLLEVLGVFGLSIACWSRWPKWAKLMSIYAAGVCYVGLAMTGSRGGYLSVAASLFVFGAISLFLLRRASAKIFWATGVVGSVVVALTIFAAVSFVQKNDFLRSRAQNTFDTQNMRVDLWRAALEQWKLEPVFGTGSGTYLFYGRQFRNERVQMDPVRTHNDYLQLLGEYGLVGAAGFVLFLWAHLRSGWRNLRRLGPRQQTFPSIVSSNRLALQVGAVCAVAAYIVHSIFDFNLHIPANVLLMAFVFAVLANPGIGREAERSTPAISILLCRVALPLIGLVILLQGLQLMPGEHYARLARKAIRHNQGAEAVLLATRGLATDRRNPNLYYYLGRGKALQGDAIKNPAGRTPFFEDAISAFEKGRALAPLDKTFAVELGFTLDELGRFAEGEWMFNEALRLDPKSMSTRGYYESHLAWWRQGSSAPASTNLP